MKEKSNEEWKKKRKKRNKEMKEGRKKWTKERSEEWVIEWQNDGKKKEGKGKKKKYDLLKRKSKRDGWM